MPIPNSKEELRQAVELNYHRLCLELAGIDAALAVERALEGHAKGTVMSVADLVAYLIGWGELVLKWENRKRKGQHVDFPETGYRWNELGQLAQKFYQDYQHLSYGQKLELLKANVVDILALLDSKTNEELYEMPWYEKWTLGRMIQLNTSSPYANARARIRKWKKSL